MASTQSVVKAILDRALSNDDFSESAASLSDETLGELVMAGFDYDEDEKTLKLVDSYAAFKLYRSLLEAEPVAQEPRSLRRALGPPRCSRAATHCNLPCALGC